MTAEIVDVTAHRRWDSRARPTVEVVVVTSGGVGRAFAPAGASTGSGEAVDLRDGGTAFAGLDVRRAVDNVTHLIAPALRGLDAADQCGVDAAIEALDESPVFANLGGNAAVATSMAVASAAAAADGLALWRIARPRRRQVARARDPDLRRRRPRRPARSTSRTCSSCPAGRRRSPRRWTGWPRSTAPAGSGWPARGRLAGVAEEGGWWPAFDDNEEALAAVVAAITGAGLRPGVDVAISLDIAATQLWADGAYHLGRESASFDAAAWGDVLAGWIERYPIASIEDPFAEDDIDGMTAFTARHGEALQVVGDDFLVTSAARVAAAASSGSVNAVLIKPNQAGTLTRARAALRCRATPQG